MSLKNQLLTDWNLDLPISGGRGTAPDDAIVIDAADPHVAGLAQLVTLRGIGQGQGVLWRKKQRQAASAGGLEAFEIETVGMKNGALVRGQQRFYFDTRAAQSASGGFADGRVISHVDGSGLALPYELGWLHMDSFTDYDTAKLGSSVEYNAPGITATVYVYNMGHTDLTANLDDPRFTAEFQRSHDEIFETRSNVTAYPDPAPSPLYRVRAYYVGRDAEHASVLWMTVARGQFVKARATWHRDGVLDEIGNDFFTALLAACGKSI
jgi:hypothetical protein